MRKFIIAFFYALDLLVSAVTFGEEGETVSARLYVARKRGSRWTWLANAVDWVALRVFHEDHHCEISYLVFTARLKAIEEYEG